MRRKKGKIHIGTSGWSYKHWKDTFYPSEVKAKDQMNYFLKFFQTVELNNSFYMLPKAETFDNWAKAVPENFIFSVKASRLITHNKKLNDAYEPLARFLQNVDHLKEHLGVILFQLPPSWKINLERLESFINILPKGYRYTFEFRNHTWYTEEVYELLRKHNIAFCIYHLEYHISPILTTADFVYVRLHGPEGKYAGSYSDKEMQEWEQRCKDWQNEGKDVYFYFDNDQNAYAVYNALTLMEMTGSPVKKKKQLLHV